MWKLSLSLSLRQVSTITIYDMSSASLESWSSVGYMQCDVETWSLQYEHTENGLYSEVKDILLPAFKI